MLQLDALQTSCFKKVFVKLQIFDYTHLCEVSFLHISIHIISYLIDLAIALLRNLNDTNNPPSCQFRFLPH